MLGEQNLPDDVSRVDDAAHGPDLISSLAVFDDGLALNARPSVVIERADHRPHFIGRMIEHDAVVGFCHCSKPPLPSSRRCLLVASRAKRSDPFLAAQFSLNLAPGGRPAWRNCAEPRPGERAPRPLRTRPGGACGETVDPTDYLTKVREWTRSKCAACAASIARLVSASARSRTIFSIATVRSGKHGCSTKSGVPARKCAICARDWSWIPVTSVASCARSSVNGWCKR